MRTGGCCRVAAIAAIGASAAGCGSVPPAPEEPRIYDELPSDDAPAPAADGGGFTIPASMNDTWNAVGQVLVRTDGVVYEGRAQMLGLYAVSYRGERFLIVTRAQVLQHPGDGMLTRVVAVLQDGRPNAGAAALELLGLLRRRLPAELALIAAGGRGRPVDAGADRSAD